MAHSLVPGSADYAAHVAGFDELLRRLAIDVTDRGIPTPSNGPWRAALASGWIGVSDHGAAPLTRAGAIEVINDHIARFVGDAVVLFEGGRQRFGTGITTTGFQPGSDAFLDDPALVCPREQFPAGYSITDSRCRSTARKELSFVGYDMSPRGGEDHGHWGFEVGEKMAATLGTFVDDLRPAVFHRAPWVK